MCDREQVVVRAAHLLRAARHAVALTGAGISTPSGIPDFRSPDSGLWNQADSMLVASLQGFQRRPELFFRLGTPPGRAAIEAQPNPAHLALAEMEAAGMLRAVITQNIDGLHQKAGSQRVHEVHGHFRLATCIRCHRTVPTQPFMKVFLEQAYIPRCPCGGILKPNVVLFGEQLPAEVVAAADQDVEQCDLMLVAGSSLEVEPVASLPWRAIAHGARLIIVNYQRTYLDGKADVVIHDDVAEILPRMAARAIGMTGDKTFTRSVGG